MGQTNLKAVADTAIGRWNRRSGTKRQPFPVTAQQEDACKHIIPAHLLDRPKMPIEDVFQAVATVELGGNFASAIL